MGWSLRLERTARRSLLLGGLEARQELPRLAAEAAASGRRARIVTDENVWAHWGKELATLLAPLTGSEPPCILPPGERSKGVEVAAACWEWLASEGLRRDDLVVAVGGGVVGDLAGFVAATYLRGVAFWQVPTSLLAQVDSSVGGKVAVNLPAGKNLVGAFYQPDLVVIDPAFLGTLPEDELVNGLGEVVKYGLLAGEPLLGELEHGADELLERNEGRLDAVVELCVRYKAEVVEEDEKEAGRRAVLNLGHTVGHALETAGGYQELAHGRAVALGLVAALRVSEEVLALDPQVRARTERLLARFSLPRRQPLPDQQQLARAMGLDKKVSARGRGFVGLRRPGEPVWGVDVPWEVLVLGLEAIAE